jgi:hypothetical protein
MKSESSLRLTSLSALLVVFVSQRLHALGKIIAHLVRKPLRQLAERCQLPLGKAAKPIGSYSVAGATRASKAGGIRNKPSGSALH